MSEDSIAWGRAEASAPLPPRKRLLAGFKKNGWSPSSSPSRSSPLHNTDAEVSLSAGFVARLVNNPESASMAEGHINKDTCSLVKLEDRLDSASMAKVEERGEDNLDAGSITKLDSSLDSSSIVKLEEHASMVVEGYKDIDIRSLVNLEDRLDSASMVKVEERGEGNLDAGSMVKLDSSLDSSSMVKFDEHDDGSVEHGDREYASYAAESMDLYNLRQRKSKRLRALPVVIPKKSNQKVSKAISADHIRLQKSTPLKSLPVFAPRKTKKRVLKDVSAEKNLLAEGCSVTDTDKDVDVSAMIVEVSVDRKALATTPTEIVERGTIPAVKSKEVKESSTVSAAVRAINEEAGQDTIAACAGNPKSGLSTCSKAKEDGSVCSEVSEPTWVPRSKAKEEDGRPRRNQSRKHHDRIIATDQNRQEVQADRSSLTLPPLSDEELARELHRIMNSSPRISRRLSYKEEGPLFYPKRN